MSLKAKARKAYSDPDRVNFKDKKSYEKHEREEMKEEKAVEKKIGNK